MLKLRCKIGIFYRFKLTETQLNYIVVSIFVQYKKDILRG